MAKRRLPELVETPAQLRQWRVEAEATQAVVGEVLGVTGRTVTAWELGEHPMPATLRWALLAARPHVESLARTLRRQRRTAQKKRERLKREKRIRARAAAGRAVIREAQQRRRKELIAIQEHRREELYASLRADERAVAKLERQGKIRPPGAPALSFIKPPRARVVRPRKIRSDIGQPHHFRGRPGKPLRPEDISHGKA